MESFSSNKSTADKKAYWCRVCKHQARKLYDQQHKEAIAAYARAYSKARPEQNRLRSLKYRLAHPYRFELNRIARDFGLTKHQYEELLQSQQGLCYICGDQLKNLNIDHCHVSGKVRKLLCKACNLGLGFFRDDINSLEKAIAYLKEHNAERR